MIQTTEGLGKAASLAWGQSNSGVKRSSATQNDLGTLTDLHNGKMILTLPTLEGFNEHPVNLVLWKDTKCYVCGENWFLLPQH